MPFQLIMNCSPKRPRPFAVNNIERMKIGHHRVGYELLDLLTRRISPLPARSPSGGVATTPKLLARRAEEYPWAEGLSVMLRGGRTPVLPVFFHGQNGLLFNAASHISMTLRLGLLMREALHRLDKPMRITIGRLLQPSELPLGSEDLPARLRAHTLALGAVPLAA